METKQRGRTDLIPLTFVLLTFLLCFGGYSLFAFKATEIVNAKPMPAAKKLVDCKQGKSKFVLRCPAGSHFNFVLGAPKAQSFRGHITLRQRGQTLYKFAISSKTAAGCNWLESHGLYGYIVNVGKDDKLGQHMRAGQTYDVIVEFSQQPNKTSLWLCWLTTQ